MNAFIDLYSSISKTYSFIEASSIINWKLELPGSGCEYRKKAGGCSMCGFHVATHAYTRGYLYPSILFQTLYSFAKNATLSSRPEKLTVFNGGSFLNDREIPSKFQKHLYVSVSKHPTVKRLMVESRCEYVTKEKVAEAVSLLDGKVLTVGIGLESQDDHIRNLLIRKGLSKDEFEKTVSMIKSLGGKSQAYVLLKPFGLTDLQAAEEVYKTIEYALSVGVDEIALSSAFVQKSTVLEKEYQKGNYSPPSLWTIVDVIKEIERKDWPVLIGGFTDNPKPLVAPSSCNECYGKLIDLIEIYRKIKVLGNFPNCTCK